jgi:hypothetical protein
MGEKTMTTKGESSYLFGIYDRGGEFLMADAGRKGWVVVGEAIGHDTDNETGRDYRALADDGFGVIVELNHSFEDGGTLPLSSLYESFATRCGHFVRQSRGCHIWVLGNEPNAWRSRPQRGTSQEEAITPHLYSRCYKKCREAIRSQPGHEDDLVLVAAVAPAEADTVYAGNKRGDWVRYLQDVLLLLGTDNYDGIAVHAYTRGSATHLITSGQHMEPPYADRHLHFRSYQDVMGVVPPRVPVFITRAHPRSPWGRGAPKQGWPNGDSDSRWVQAAYQEVDSWNQSHPERQIRSMVLYRWGRTADDESLYSVQNRPDIIRDFSDALANDYQWSLPPRPDYRTAFLTHNSPETAMAGDTIHVEFTLRNDGSKTWKAGPPNPFRLCSHWYDADNLKVLVSIGYHNDLPHDVAPGEEVTFKARTMAPTTPGHYRLRWEMLHEGVTWFTRQGDQAQTVPIEVLPAKLPHKPPIEEVFDSLPQHPQRRYETRQRANIGAVIIHHSAVPAVINARRIAAYHVERHNWPGIGYHFFVGPDGHIQQTQPLEAISYHAGDRGNQVGVGICLAGDFTEQPPPQVQLESAAALVAWLLDDLDLPLSAVYGHCDFKETQCPGLTWAGVWREPLLDSIASILKTARPPAPTPKLMDHYILFWGSQSNWARDEWRAAENYIGQFRVTMGFSVEDARHARFVTIVGSPSGISTEVEAHLRAAGCRVERIPGDDPERIKAIFDEMAVHRQPFLTLAG